MMATDVSTTARHFHVNRLVLLLAGIVLLGALAVIVAQYALDDDTSERAGVTLTDEDNASTVSVALGDEIVIRLESNITTGYEWEVAEVNQAVLTYLGSEYEAPDTNLVGAGGIQVLRFEATSPGESTIALKYWRPFEGDSSIVNEFVVTATVPED
jgi:inhibitor of cysteine peptidase